MKTKTQTQIALDAAVALRDGADRAYHDAKAAFDHARVYAREQRARVVALKAAVVRERQEAAAARAQAKAERQVRAQARKEAAVAKAEARLAKARERALKPVGVKKAKADRKPGAVTVIVPSKETVGA